MHYPYAPRKPFHRTGTVVGTWPAYVTLYDSGDPAALGGSGVLPAPHAYLTARVTTPSGVVTAGTLTDAVLFEIVHMVDATAILVEEFGAFPSASAADGDGSDFRTIACGYEILPRGNRVLIRAAGSVASMAVDFVLHWGQPERPRVTEVGGRFAYSAAGGSIPVGTFFARAGILRPMKSAVLTASLGTGATGAAFSATVRGLRATRTAGTTVTYPAQTMGVLTVALAASVVLAGAGADAAIDQTLGLDGLEIYNEVQLEQAAPDTGSVLWRLTTVHV